MKKILMFVSLTSLVLASCSETEILDNLTQTPDYHNPSSIGFLSNTTRASVSNLEAIKESTTGFQVFGYANGADVWYCDSEVAQGLTINGKNNYFWNNNKWFWDDATSDNMNPADAPSWPGEGAYPMTFFALYPPMATYMPENVVAVEPFTVVVNTTVADQVDMMAAWNQAAKQAPTNGKLDLDFKHILSKVNVSVQVSDGYTVEVAKAQFVNIKNNRKYDYSKPSAEAWAAEFDGQGTDAEIRDAYLYMAGLKEFAATGEDLVETLRPADNGNLMPIPQKLVAVVATERATVDTDFITDNAATMDNGAYIEVVYRMYSKDGDLPKIGMSSSNDHSYLTTVVDEKVTPHSDWKLYGTYDGEDKVVTPTSNSKLYIKAYYPIKDDLKMSNGYIYELQMKTAGSGYYVDDTYYDENGNDTNLPIDIDGQGAIDPVDPTDPVSQNEIHFNVTESAWAEN